MSLVFGLLSTLIFLAIPVGIVVLIVRGVRGRADAAGPRATGVMRRFFHYLLMATAAFLTAPGVAGLLSGVFPQGNVLVRSDSSDLAIALALTIVGAPAFYGLAMWSRRFHHEDQAERASVAWPLYLNLVLVVSLITAMTGAFGTLQWIFGLEGFDPRALSRFLVWGALWVGHWRAANMLRPTVLPNLHALIGSAVGLGPFLVGVGLIVGVSLSAMYEGVVNVALVGRGIADDLLGAVAVGIVGLVPWWWHWLRVVRPAEPDTLRHAYLLLVGILGGLLTALVAAGTIVFSVLEWFVGDVGSSAAAHFDIIPPAIAGLSVGLWAWWYHSSVLEGREETGGIRRVYDYLVASVGLVAASAGLTTLVAAIVEALTPTDFFDRGVTAGETLAAAITLFVVGGPLWWRFFTTRQSIAEQEDSELTSLARRVYLFLPIGVGSFVALTSLVVLLFQLLQDVIDGEFGAETIRDARIAMALLITVGAVAGYHWSVYRADRERTGATPASRDRWVLLVAPAGTPVPEVARLTGAKVRLWERLDQPGGDEGQLPDNLPTAEEIAAAVDAQEGTEVLVLVSPGSVEAVPYRPI